MKTIIFTSLFLCSISLFTAQIKNNKDRQAIKATTSSLLDINTTAPQGNTSVSPLSNIAISKRAESTQTTNSANNSLDISTNTPQRSR